MALRLPGVYYKERVTYEENGEGSKIPVFIGKTGNTVDTSTTDGHVPDEYKVDGTLILSFSNVTDALKPVIKSGADWKDKTGIGGRDVSGNIDANNELAQVINDFYEEAKLLQSTDIGVPNIYVIDVGAGDNLDAWTNAITNAKRLFDATVEVYVGAENIKINNQTYALKEFIDGVALSIEKEAEDLNLRYGFLTKKNATDTELKDITTSVVSECDIESIKKYSRIGLIEPNKFGKHVARICCTPNNTEPGYQVFRSVSPGTFVKRTKEEMEQLQAKGIIFGRDEHINGTRYPKINLCTSIAFAYDSRPADSLFHARFNADDLLREVFEACYPQIKANESLTNIAYLQTRLNKIVNDRVNAEEMVKYNERTEEGTKLVVSQSEPYTLNITGQIQPVKCTIAIDVESTIRL